MTFRKITLLLSFIIILAGCNHSTSSYSENEDSNIKQLSTNVDQQTATQVKESLMERADIETVHAVNTKDTLLVTIEVPHHKRFSLQDIRETYQQELKQNFPHFTVELSTDQKIILEISELEEKLTANALTKEDFEQELKKIIKLSKEQT